MVDIVSRPGEERRRLVLVEDGPAERALRRPVPEQAGIVLEASGRPVLLLAAAVLMAVVVIPSQMRGVARTIEKLAKTDA